MSEQGEDALKARPVGCQAGTDMGYLAQPCSGWMLSWAFPYCVLHVLS
jgi:hypothetical protein